MLFQVQDIEINILFLKNTALNLHSLFIQYVCIPS
jgi:hypothetical protein